MNHAGRLSSPKAQLPPQTRETQAECELSAGRLPKLDRMSVQFVHQNPWFMVSHEQRGVGADRTDWYRVVSANSAMVIPVTPSGDLVLIRGTRDTTGHLALYELPCGALDAGESAIVAGARELREETGITASSFAPIGEFYASPGLSSAKTFVFEATGLHFGEPANEPGENWTVETVSESGVLDLIASGLIRDAGTLAALLLRHSTRSSSPR